MNFLQVDTNSGYDNTAASRDPMSGSNMPMDDVNATQTGGMQSTNYPTHQHGRHGRNTLTKPNPNSTAVDPTYGNSNTGDYSSTGNTYDTSTSTGPTTGLGAGIPTSNTTTSGTRNTTSNTTGTIPGDYPSLSAAKKEARIGKIETTVGKVVHSTSLKEKGAIHLENAEAIQNQHGSLKEAERLEALAQEARQRADQHGMVVDAARNAQA